MAEIKLVNKNGKIVGIDPSTGDEVPIELGDAVADSLRTDQKRITNGPITWSPDDGTLLEGLQEVPEGDNGEFKDMFLGELKLIPSVNDTFGATDFKDINNDADDTPNGVTIHGTGQQSTTPIIGSGDHTLHLSTNDASVQGLSVRQEDSSGDYDAIHVSEREARIKDIGIDAAPRSGIHVESGSRGIIEACEVKGGDDQAVFIDGKEWTVSDVILQDPISGGFVLGPNSAGCVVSNLIVKKPEGTEVLTIDGNLNNVSARIIAANNGQTLKISNDRNVVNGSYYIDTIDVEGDNNVLTGVYDNLTNDFNVSGSGNVVYGWIDGDVTIDGDDNDLSNCIVTGYVSNNGSNNSTP